MDKKKIETKQTKAERQKIIVTRYWVKKVLDMTADEIKAILIK